jgi:phosphoribosylaminoimidazolecarboxamide formyltransferase/IMP cyclohydrolase
MSEKKLAAVSTADKRYLEEIARELHELGYEIWSSTGSLGAIRKAGVPANDLGDWTGMGPGVHFDHRVVTISTRGAAGMVTDRERHASEMSEKGFDYFDFVYYGLYKLDEIVKAKEEAGKEMMWDDIIKNFDVGGPMALEASSKGGGRKIATTPEEALQLIERMKRGEKFTQANYRFMSFKAAAAGVAHQKLVVELMARNLGFDFSWDDQ